jgi:hypothetical protein
MLRAAAKNSGTRLQVNGICPVPIGALAALACSPQSYFLR